MKGSVFIEKIYKYGKDSVWSVALSYGELSGTNDWIV